MQFVCVFLAMAWSGSRDRGDHCSGPGQSDGSLDQELGRGFRAGFLGLGTTGTSLSRRGLFCTLQGKAGGSPVLYLLGASSTTTPQA